MTGDHDKPAGEGSATTPSQNDQPSVPPSEEAKKIFEEYLKLSTFFKRHQDLILDKLEESDEVAEEAPSRKIMIFFAESLPIIDGLIQIGTTRKEYDEALKKVGEEIAGWRAQDKTSAALPSEGQAVAAAPPLDPRNYISALTFEYVVARGLHLAEERAQAQGDAAAHQEAAKRLEVWQRIKHRVDLLTGQGSA
jgi:hypothetical protein